MKKANISKTILFLLAVIILIQPVLALGVTPARSVIDFEPGLRKSVTIKIMNNEHKIFKAIAYARGELANYTKIKDTIITLTEHDDYKELTYELILPDSMKKPGMHTSEIIILELREFADKEETVVTATASVSSQVRLRVPYPEKYAEAQLHISGADVEEGINFVIPIFNYGTQDIRSAKAKIRILGATYDEVAVLNTNEISLKATKEGKLAAIWQAEVNPGMYHAVAEIDYDGNPIKIEQNFEVGNMVIDIEDIRVDDFVLGDIAKFDIYLRSRWNQPIENVHADVSISDKNQRLHSSKTASIDMPPFTQRKLEAYWDTKGISVGVYNVDVILHYGGKITERLFEVNVNIDSIRTALTAEVIAPKGGLDRNTILVTLVIIMIAINIGWFIYIKKIRKNKK